MPPEPRDSFRRDTAFIAGVQLVARLRGLLIVPLVFGVLGDAAYGRWTVALGVVALVTGFAHGNVHVAMMRGYGSAEPQDRRTLLWTLVVYGIAAGGAAGGALAALAPWLGFAVGGGPDAVPLLRAAGAHVASSVWVHLALNALRSRGRVRAYAVLTAVLQFVEIGAAALAALAGWSLAGAILLLAAVDAVTFAACLPATARADPPVRPSGPVLREALAFSLPTIPLAMGEWIMSQGDRVVIAALLGAGPAGVYAAAYALASVASFVVRPVQVVLLPHTAPIWDRGERARVQRSLSLALKAYLALALPAAFGLALVGQAALALLTRRSYPDWSVPLLIVLALGNALYGASIVALHPLQILRRTGRSAVAALAGAALNLSGNLVLVPVLGLFGAALMTLLAYGVCLAWMLAAAWDELPLRVGAVDLVKMAVGTAAMSGLVLAVGTHSLPRLGASIVGGAAAYVAAVMALRLLAADERRTLFGRWAA